MRKGKALWTEQPAGEKPVFYEADEEAGEALYCARKVVEMKRMGYRYSDFAVLMRINALTRSFEQEFTKYGIPYKIFGGFKFFERKEVKDILAYLRVIANPFDGEAVMRIINVPRRGIGDKTVQTLMEYAQQEELSLYDAVLDCDLLPLAAGAREKVRAFGAYIKDLVVRSQELDPSRLAAYLVESSGMKEQYAGNQDENVAKRANIDEFLNSVDEFVRMNEGASLADYLQMITLYSDTDEMDEGEYITIATVHAVKGLEFRCVFFAGLEDNIMPTSRALDDPSALEEERRLMYVAITRAREQLFLTRSRSRYLYGRREPTMRSRFVEELKEELGISARSAGMEERRGYGSSYGNSYGNSYGGYNRSGWGSSSPVRVGRASAQREDDSYYRTFGGSRSTPSNVPAPKPAPSFAPPVVSKEKDVSGFQVGVHVKHARFGEGVITAVRGGGSNLIITVHFDTVGNKDLAAALAPLTIV